MRKNGGKLEKGRKLAEKWGMTLIEGFTFSNIYYIFMRKLVLKGEIWVGKKNFTPVFGYYLKMPFTFYNISYIFILESLF
jgi:hypothetical protein